MNIDPNLVINELAQQITNLSKEVAMLKVLVRTQQESIDAAPKLPKPVKTKESTE